MSLIGMHSAARDGFTIPSAPVKWKYLKGSEKDFDGAPGWVTRRIKGECSYNHSFVGVVGKKLHVCDIDDKNRNGVAFNEGYRHEIIAQREPIADEDDLNECISSTEALITERGARYGKFKDGSEIMRDLKHVMHEVDGWNNLSPSQKEALDMIQHKIGRILNGDPNYDDSWKDVAGYATLIVNELNGEIK